MEAMAKRRHEDLITVSWLTAHYSAYNFSKRRMPPLANELRTPEDQRKLANENKAFLDGLAKAGKIDVYTGGKISDSKPKGKLLEAK
jgi:hypothetical protein